MSEALRPGATLGILGGGQLGRMLSVAAARLGFKTCIFEPNGDCPASHVSNYHFKADYDDSAALDAFAQAVDMVTYEFENIPTAALDAIEAICPIRPGRDALRVSQDRFTEKDFLSDLGLKTAPYRDVTDRKTLERALDEIGTPSILKTRRFGYDGKGQVRIAQQGDADTAYDALAGAPAILEGFVEFSHEISVIATRGLAGEVVAFDPGENVHEAGILRTTRVPAAVSRADTTDAVLIAGKILDALDYVGVIGVELFVTPNGLVVNEIAPRVHNSGHWTQNACVVDQFEQHIRAVTGLPLGDGRRFADVEMQNLLGAEALAVADLAAQPDTAVHLYGKAEAKVGRKMGHVNRILRGD